MPNPLQPSGHDDGIIQQDASVIREDIDAVGGSGDRLMDFLAEWCGLDADAQDTAEMLHSDQGAYYRDWLPKELGEALLSGRITPQPMSERLGIHFDNQDKLDEFFRHRWLVWFPGSPYPMDDKAGE